MEVIFPLRAQTQYWISLEAFFCVWNLSPISPPDTDDFHRAAGETACAGVCPLCGKRVKSALIGFYIHVRQRGCSWSSQRRVTPTKRGELHVLLLCVIGQCSWLTRRLDCSGAGNSSWAFCFSVSFEALTPKFQKRDQNAVPRLEKKSLNRYISQLLETLNWLIYRFIAFLLNSLLQTKIKCNKIRGRPARGKKR